MNNTKKKSRTHVPVEGYTVEDLQTKTLDELVEIAKDIDVENPNDYKRQDLMFEILKSQTSQGGFILFTGILEITDNGFGFLRSIDGNFSNSDNDAYVSATQIRKFGLREGDVSRGKCDLQKIKRDTMHF